MNRFQAILLFLIILLFFSSRIPLIEKDLPPIDVSGYAQVDEEYYAVLALDKIDYGNFFFSNNGTIEPHSTFLGSSFLLNASCYLMLKIIGDTYWGLRTSSILFAFLVIVMLIISFNKIKFQIYNEDNNQINLIGFALILILCTDFSFLFSNIVVEPTLIRLAVSLLMIILSSNILKKNSSFVQYYLLGIAALFSWLLVYLVNIFIPVSIGTAILAINIIKRKNLFKNVLPYFLGICTGAFCFIGFAYLSKINLQSEIQYIYSNFGSRTSITGVEKAGFIKSILINGINFFKANFFNYNPLLLFLFLSSTISYGLLLIKNKIEKLPSIAFISLIFLIIFFFQSLFINDFFTRKILITFPFYLLLTFTVLSLLVKDGFSLLSKANWVTVITLSGVLVILSQYTQNWIYHCELSASFLKIIKPALVALFLILGVLFTFLLSRKLHILIIAFFLLLIGNNLYYSYSFAYKNVTDNFKQSMEKIGPLVNHSHLIGGWSLGFRLYNTSLPTINPYMYYNKNKEYENDIKKTITMYSKAYMITYKDDSLVTKLNLKSKTILVNDFCTNDFVLYQIK